ncbi:MAG: hypothetical protein KatS3mg027_1245 [Bacteroidia bacterium]|nr:MAG: hypothetical protein KatS3mg027_1245 [Bacteroidia bacterium]
MEKKNILIINYVFPPYPGIGGRRWAKFAKYLHRRGHNVYVIAAQNPFDYESTFINDIKELPKENLFYLPSLYPKIMISPLKSWWDKLKYQFWYRVLPLFTDGNYYDRSMFWKRQLQNKIEELIHSKNIQTIIVSGPPFHYVYYTVQLREKYPDIKFIVDYRDEWTFNGVHGIDIIGEKRKQKEIEKERYVCGKADVVLSCHEVILDYLNNLHENKKGLLMQHAYDKDDFGSIKSIGKNDEKSNKDMIISIFGTIEQSKVNYLGEILRQFEKHRELYKKININIYSFNTLLLSSLINYKSKINFFQNVKPEILFNEIKLSDFVLVFHPDRQRDLITTKFPEIFYLQKPILFFCEKGLVSDFIIKHKIGVHLTEENFNEKFLYALKHPEEFSYKNFPIEEWDYEYRTNELEKMI